MGRTKMQAVTGAQSWRQRMIEARKLLKELDIGQQAVLMWITQRCPAIDRLTLYTRWKNAWSAKNADPEFTDLVEKAANYFRDESDKA